MKSVEGWKVKSPPFKVHIFSVVVHTLGGGGSSSIECMCGEKGSIHVCI
jgi:hypothetical protein